MIQGIYRLAAQFELPRSVSILLTVPLSMTGALADYFSGGTPNVFSQIGLVTLVGLITKHGILIVTSQTSSRPRARTGWPR